MLLRYLELSLDDQQRFSISPHRIHKSRSQWFCHHKIISFLSATNKIDMQYFLMKEDLHIHLTLSIDVIYKISYVLTKVENSNIKSDAQMFKYHIIPIGICASTLEIN